LSHFDKVDPDADGGEDEEVEEVVEIPNRNFNYVTTNENRQVKKSSTPVYAKLWLGVYQLKCQKLNKFMPVESFDLLDPATGKRANRSRAGKEKQDALNSPLSARVSSLVNEFDYSPLTLFSKVFLLLDIF
jgi:hypothetical protein